MPRQSAKSPNVPMQTSTEPVRGGSYGERIAAALGRAGKSRAWLAKEIGVQWQTVDAWTRGGAVSGRNIELAAEALNMSPAELLGVLDGQDPPFVSWEGFLATPDAATMTPEERVALAGIPWPTGRQPTVASYLVALTALRTSVPR